MKLASIFFLLFVLYGMNSFAGTQPGKFDYYLERAVHFKDINTDSILHYGLKALDAAQETDNPKQQVLALEYLIKTQIKKGEFSKAILYWQKADSIVSANQLDSLRVKLLMYKGLVYEASGLNSEGLKYYFEAKKITGLSSDNSFSAEMDYYIALAFSNINEFDKSREYARLAIAEDLVKKDSTSIIKSLLLIADSFLDIDSAEYYLDMANTVSQRETTNLYRVALLSNLALLYKSTGRTSQAKTLYLEGIKIGTANGFLENLSTLYNNYAYLLMDEMKYDSAGYCLSKAMTIAKDLKNNELEANISDSYSDLYAKTGNFEKSLEFYKQSVKLKDEYRARQQAEESLFLSTVFETEKKQQEIERQKARIYRTNAILFALIALFATAVAVIIYMRQRAVANNARMAALEQNKKLDIANAMIEGQDSERKRLAMDLHDGIMPMIGSLQLLVDNNFEKNRFYPAVKSSIKEIGSDIRELSHRMLPSQLESKGLVASLENYIHLLSQSQPANIQIHTDLADRLAAHYEMNIYFLFYEMINNAVKHSGATEITVQLLDDNDVLNLSVEDNGKGFDTEKDYSGIGLKNIRQRVNYLGGTMAIDSVPGQGTAFLIEIKKPQA